MHSLSLALIALMAVVTLPTYALAYINNATDTNNTEGTELEEPKTLPLTDALQSENDKQMKDVNEIWQEDVHEVMIRKQRGAKDNGSGTTTDSCRYTKGAWSECDAKSNTRSRTLTLKKGEGSCVQTRTIQKKCKKNKSEKACRYDKGTFGECQPSGEMTRIDKLKSTSDSATCQATRTVTKKCNKSKQEKPVKDRNSKEKKQKERKNRQ